MNPTKQTKYLMVQLERQVERFQGKCEDYEQRIQQLLPRVSELEQAERTAKANTNLAAIGWAIGGCLVSAASLFSHDAVKWLTCGFGGALVIWASVSILVSNRTVWTKKRQE